MQRRISSEDIHVWTGNESDLSLRGLESELSEEERIHACRFRRIEHRSSYIFSHFMLRHVLGSYLDRSPSEIHFHRNEFGKPYVTEVGSPLAFNMSHSGRLVVIAISGGREIGVDVEGIRPISDVIPLSEACFSPKERAFVLKHSLLDQGHAFLRCWTRKEAYVKAIGRGLSVALSSFDTFEGVHRTGLPSLTRQSGPLDLSWWLTDVQVPNPYLAAVAIEAGMYNINYFKLSDTLVRRGIPRG